jgi:hypothetical protein
MFENYTFGNYAIMFALGTVVGWIVGPYFIFALVDTVKDILKWGKK